MPAQPPDVRGPGSKNARFRRVCPASSEFDHIPPRRSMADQGCFRRNQRFESDRRKQKRFRYLPFNQGSPDVQNRLPFKEYGAFGYSKNIAREPEFREVFPEPHGSVPKVGETLQVANLVRSEMEIQEIVDDTVNAGDDNEFPMAGKTTNRKLERAHFILFACREITRGHG